MTPRRSHAKSRSGCDTCRARRVKYDETGPPCYNCRAREIARTYFKAQKNRNTNPNLVSTTSPVRISRNLTQKRELELLHKYSTSTYRDLAHIFDSQEDDWKVFVVQHAFKHEFLLNGLLSLTASHAATESIVTRQDYLLSAAEYLEPALPEFRLLLSDISDESVIAIYVFGVFLCTSLISQIESTVVSMSWSELVDRLIGIHECLVGIKKTTLVGRDIILASPLGSMMARWEAKHQFPVDERIATFLSPLKTLTHYNPPASQHSDDDGVYYEKLVDDLILCWSHQLFVIDWYTSTTKDFQVNLKQGKIMEVLLLAHWGVALHTLREYWFVGGLGRTIAHLALQQMDSVGPQFFPFLSWVRTELDFKGGWSSHSEVVGHHISEARPDRTCRICRVVVCKLEGLCPSHVALSENDNDNESQIQQLPSPIGSEPN